MEEANGFTRTAACARESGRTAKVTARELTSGLIEVYTRESSRMTTGMARELSITKTVTSILVSGERVICTARE